MPMRIRDTAFSSAAWEKLVKWRITGLADEILGLEGRRIAPREAMGPAEPLMHGPLVRLPLLDGEPGPD